MDRVEILSELHAVIAARLLGNGPWLMDPKTAHETTARQLEMGLVKQSSKDAWELTPLGEEIDCDLLSVFMGTWDEGDIPTILRERGVITQSEADSMYDQWDKCADAELVMKSYVQKAYLRCFRPPKSRF
jgi:hypothetical protein